MSDIAMYVGYFVMGMATTGLLIWSAEKLMWYIISRVDYGISFVKWYGQELNRKQKEKTLEYLREDK